jgi:hypothetical protein
LVAILDDEEGGSGLFEVGLRERESIALDEAAPERRMAGSDVLRAA